MGESLWGGKFLFGTYAMDETHFEFLSIEIALEIEDVYFQRESMPLESGPGADIHHAVELSHLVAQHHLYGVNTRGGNQLAIV